MVIWVIRGMTNVKKRKILSVISIRLIMAVGIACILSLVGLFLLLSNRAKNDALDLVTSNVIDLAQELYTKTDVELFGELDYYKNYYIQSADQIDWEGIMASWKQTDEMEENIKKDYQISVIRNDGRIMETMADEVRGVNVLTNVSEEYKAAAGILKIIKDEENEITEFRGSKFDFTACNSMKPMSSFSGKDKRRYYGKSLNDYSGIIINGVSDAYYMRILNYVVGNGMNYRRIGRDGYVLSFFSDSDGLKVDGGSILGEEGFPKVMDDFPYPELVSELESSSQFENISTRDQIDKEADIPVYYTNGQTELYGKASFYAVTKVGDSYIMTVYPKDKAEHSMYTTLTITFLMEVLIFVLLFTIIFIIEKKIVINDIYKINSTLARITQGNLEEKADVRDTYEFDALSTDINTTVDRLKAYIAEAAARIDADLEIAKAIQTSALPSVFPPFPEQKEFELFASMHAAKEVGGDFYDYYMLSENTLGFLIADVSGKSIPGAMFMMTSKTVIKGLAESGLPVDEVFTEANEKLCEGNDAEMFLTAWMGYLDLKTGLVKVANAGHNPPVLIRDGKAEYVILKPGLMLAGMDGTIYKEHTLQLQNNDILYLYTDGVTEAMDADENQYGEDRLIELLSFGNNYPAPAGDNGIAGAVCKLVKEDIDRFVKGAEQSDDITMLCVKYLGKS